MTTTESRPSTGGRPPMGGGGRPGGGARKPGGRFGRSFFSKRKVCRFCQDKMHYIDFKNMNLLRSFITERGKMISARTTGVCTSHQRGLMKAIKRARNIALLPFSAV